MTRAEVYKVGVTHYFSIEKAKNELGYEPEVNSHDGAKMMAEYYQLRGALGEHKDFFRVVPLQVVCSHLGGLYACYCIAFQDPLLGMPLGRPTPQ